MQLQQIIEKHWYQKNNFWLSILFWPLAIIYNLSAKLRKLAYQTGWLRSYKLNVPLVIVGNISVGGAGKTPLCKMLAGELTKDGYQIGIILRGYKGSNQFPRLVTASDHSSEVGDEALIYAQAGFKVAIGSNRVATGELLLQSYPQTQLIIADDGMQHYRLQRDLEICVVDSSRLFGNRQILPMGPLRETMRRLHSVDAIVVTGKSRQAQQQKIWSKLLQPVYSQQLLFERFYNPKTQQSASVAELNHLNPQLIAAIGNPQRFFDYLSALGLNYQQSRAFPDHYHYLNSDIDPQVVTITTEKDYTKLAGFELSNIWVAQVTASLNNRQLLKSIENLIPKKNKI